MAQAPAFSLDFAAATDIGCHRGNNEDSFGYDTDNQLYVVCDGMGGSAAGEVASNMAVRALIECFEFLIQQSAENNDSQPIESRLLHSIHEANRLVHEAATTNPEHQNMGTTLVCATLDDSRLVIGNVGDSRCYLIRNGSSHQITLDHSLLDEQLRMGLITPEVAAASNLQSVITRAIGTTETVEPDLFAVDLQPGDMFLLTSDGLTRYAKPEDIANAARPEFELTAICQTLIDHAKQRGGVDNITCMMLRAFETPIESTEQATTEPAQEPSAEFTAATPEQSASQ
ncbi:Stp1/IreP family PP2C-type Ser/Thr phosphatase [Acidicapsa dinghuensis]|uniref:Stp1/IreP family PP2C-type Ser/Thr phosphatase n=1 Tax=Acidicapsa dinghuensis TaxID=2218256 RepID=A0ABW1EJB6_9BACT|nr:Stp1/IreP family PP2C-type Ser/Thr phosphatase [Acidicapsa dinghuensis]